VLQIGGEMKTKHIKEEEKRWDCDLLEFITNGQRGVHIHNTKKETQEGVLCSETYVREGGRRWVTSADIWSALKWGGVERTKNAGLGRYGKKVGLTDRNGWGEEEE